MVFEFFKPSKGQPQAHETKASATGRVVALASSGRVAWSARDTVSLTKSGFQNNPIGFRAVKVIVEAAAALPILCQDCQHRYDQHPVLALLARPNGAQSRAEFLEALYGHLLLSGNGYIEAVAGPSLPTELHVLRPDRMSLVPGPDGWPSSFEYTVAGRVHRFHLGQGPSPICHIRSFHPQDDHYGLSPLQAAAVAIDVHNSASSWSKALLDNAARPSGAIVFKGNEAGASLSPDQYDRLVFEMESHHQGARNAGRPMLLEGGLDWKPMGFSPSDMEFHETKLAAAREIATAFGVPPMLLGIPGDATYANYQEANRAFYRLTVLPLAARVLSALSAWLAQYCDEFVELRPDLDQISALSHERDHHWARISAASFLSDQEKRQLLGFGPLTQGE